MTALHHLATASPYIAALVVLLVIVSIGVLIWACLPERDRNSDIDRQIATLRRHADHAVATRPRVRRVAKPWVSLLRIKRLFAVREAKKLIRYSPDVRAAWRRSRRASAALGKTIQEYERAARVVKPKACGGGLCRHRADCSDTYCPGRLSASLSGHEAHRHASH